MITVRRFSSIVRAALPLIFLTCLLQSTATSQLVIQLRSGNGPLGGQDSDISFLIGPPDSPFDHTLSPADFAAAEAGTSAFIVAPHPAWIASLPADPAAQWISTDVAGANGSGSTALYAMSFDVPTTQVQAATLDFSFAVDNALGATSNQGVYLNGTPVPGTQWPDADSFEQQHVFADVNVASLLHAGENTLFVNGVDVGGTGGVVFSARLELTLTAWVDLGGSLAGHAGTPALLGLGTLQPGAPLSLSLSAAKPFASSWLVVGISQLNAPFKGGIMVPNPHLMFALTTDFFGKSSFGGLWPSGVPSDFTTYFQWWIQDPAGAKGFAASNAVSGTTP